MNDPSLEEVSFQSSSLGTKQHWDEQYDTELKNFEEIGDIGEVWFGEESVERVSRWLDRQDVSPDVSVLDLGCGNGASLLSLWEYGFTNLTGVDYSESGISLARQIAKKQQANINYQVGDLLQDSISANQPALSTAYDVCLDKGTYDAISLCPDGAVTKRRLYELNVAKLTKKDGLFLITSCNWTVDELKNIFIGEDFEFRCVLPTPKFQFGGREGSSTSVVVFTKLR